MPLTVKAVNKAQKKGNATPIGIDLGYGYTKAVWGVGDDIVFPSVYSETQQLDYQRESILRNNAGFLLTDEEGTFFTGDLAASEGRVLRDLRGRGVDDTEGRNHRLKMFRTALAQIFNGDTSGDVAQVHVCVGLPLNEMRNQDALKQTLGGQHHIKTDNTDFVADVAGVLIIPQPMGTIMAYRFDRKACINKRFNAKSVSVLDIGTYNINLGTDIDGGFKAQYSGAVDVGIWHAQERLAGALSRQFPIKRSEMDAEFLNRALSTSTITIQGEKHTVADLVRDAIAEPRKQSLDLLQRKINRGALIDTIAVSGGGANLIGDSITDEYPHAATVDGAQTANAAGFYIAGLLHWNNG